MILRACLLILSLFITGCFNDNSASFPQQASTATIPPSATPASGPSFTLTSVQLNPAPPAAANQAAPAAPVLPTLTLNFNAVNLTTPTLNNVCQASTGGAGTPDLSRACDCHFQWSELNQASSTTITRTVNTTPTEVTSFEVKCPVPIVWNNEIPDKTTIAISLIPDVVKGNTSNFTTNTINYTKEPVNFSADFRDAEGHGFKNIFHYVCFDKVTKNLSITHIQKAPFNSNGGGISAQVSIANEFQIGTDSSTSFSAQSYYYDFYVRSHELGSPNLSNSQFMCPLVNITTGSTTEPSLFPMDSSFALALNTSSSYPIAIAASTLIPTGDNSDKGKILGYAAKPNGDGTCPSFLDSTGKLRLTFRLRQYSAIYPIRYKADGDILDQSQPINTIYIMDRPVNKSGQDPLKPITRLGPKPCPFSFKSKQFGYKCTNDATLAGSNIDGIQIQGDPFCPVYPPPPDKYIKSDGSVVIRPYKPFGPHYLENVSFKACAFQSSTPIDPAMVVSHNDSVFSASGPHDFYCAKYYPAAGAIIPAPNGDPFDKPPGDCDITSSNALITADKTFACTETFNSNVTTATLFPPKAGCCQICSGADCTAAGGGTHPVGRNAAFSPPQDAGNPPQSVNLLPQAQPNDNNAGDPHGCFDPDED